MFLLFAIAPSTRPLPPSTDTFGKVHAPFTKLRRYLPYQIVLSKVPSKVLECTRTRTRTVLASTVLAKLLVNALLLLLFHASGSTCTRSCTRVQRTYFTVSRALVYLFINYCM